MYDLRDGVLPVWVDRREPGPDEAMRSLLEISSKALGMCTPAQVAHYFHAKQADARPLIDRLIARGRLVTVTARLADGADHELVVHRDNLPLLQRAADGELRPRRTTFLSPFDSLFWASGRDRQFWRFRQSAGSATSHSRNASGATSVCRFWTATAWWAASTPSWSAPPACCASRSSTWSRASSQVPS